MTADEIKLKRQERWEEFYTNVSIEGFQYLFEERGWKRFVWIILFIGAIVLSVYLFRGVVQDYIEFKTYSSFEIEHLHDENFPTITLCNINSVLRSKVEKLALNITADEFMEYYKAFHPMLHNASMEDVQKVINELERYNITSAEELMMRTNSNISDMLDENLGNVTKYSCVIYGSHCTYKDFVMASAWMLQIFYCSEFNPYLKDRKSIKVQGSGIENSFVITANLNVDDLLYSPFEGQGLMVLIHPYGTPCFLPEYAVTYFAVPGHMNVVSLVAKKYELLPAPYSSACGSRELKILKGYPYSKAACEADCVLQGVNEICKCVSYVTKEHVRDDIRICDLRQHICYMQQSRRLASNRTCDCPSPCTEFSYQLRSSSLELDAEYLARLMENNTNRNYAETKRFVKRNTLTLWIYFENMFQQKEITTPSATFAEFIGSVGGNVGLCIGFSLITIFEVFEFAWDYATIGRKN